MEQIGVKMPVEVRGTSIENTFIIPVISNYKGVDKCIETIYNYNENFRIYLIDQTKDGKCAYLQDKVHLYIKTQRNLGFAKAMNTGIVIAMRESKYITLCNDDVEFVHKDWFPKVKEYLEKRPEVLGLNPASIRAFTPDRTKDWMPYKEKYTEEDIKYLFEPKEGENCEFTYNPAWFFEGAMMFCTVFPSRAFEIVGLLDEGFFPGCFTGETTIKIYDDTNKETTVSFSDLATNYKDKKFYVSSYDVKLQKEVKAEASNPRKTKEVTHLIEIELENGSKFQCTPEHLLLTSIGKGKYFKAKNCILNEYNPMPLISNNGIQIIKSGKHIKLDKPVSVYDLTVDKYHNFALSSGIIVHNSSEDYDWCRRCYALGYRMGHFNGAWVYHHWLTSKNAFDWNSGEKEKYRAYPAFPDKWKSEEEPEPDIYGKKGKMDKPTFVVPL